MRCRLSVLAVAVVLASMMVFSQGCATIVTGTKRSVDITSDPTGAAFVVYNSQGDTVFKGTTPAKAKLKPGNGWFKAQEFRVEFELGNRKATARIEHGLNGWYIAGNFFFGGVIGWVIIDPLSGAMWTLDDVHGILEPASVSQGTGDTLRIIAIDQVPTELQGRMVRIN